MQRPIQRLAVIARRGAARHPWITRVLIATLAGCGGLISLSHERALDARQREWGHSTMVWVARRSVQTGEPIIADLQPRPTAMIPATAVRSLPSGTVAQRSITANEIVLDNDVVAAGVAAVLLPDTVAIDTVRGRFSGSVGNRVVLFAQGTQLGEGDVIAVNGDIVTVAVAVDVAAVVALAANDGSLVLAVAARS